ncbi:MAG: hypothetical protein GY751_18880 [Bacteroidetes bacterium]|nr:hypothetical protein [Bacteroidota bacterium]
MTWKNIFLLAASFTMLVIGVNVVFLLSNTSWIITDDSFFLDWTFIGRRIPFRGFTEGRFSPLSWQDYNLMIPFRDHPFPYYVWSSVKYLLAGLIMWKSGMTLRKAIYPDEEIDHRFRALSLIILLLAVNSVAYYQSYVDIVYPEQNLLVLIPLYFLIYLRTWRRATYLHYAVLFCIALVILLSKEMGFVLLAPFSFVALVTGRGFISRKETGFHISIFLICLSYVFFYYFKVFLSNSGLYSPPDKAGFSVAALLLLWVVLHPILISVPFIIVHFFRRRIYSSQSRKALFFSSLLASALAVLVFYIYLGYSAPYYLAPVSPLLFYLCIYLISENRPGHRSKYFRAAVTGGVMMVLVISLVLSGMNWHYWNQRRIHDFDQINEALDYHEKGYEVIFLDLDEDLQEVSSPPGQPFFNYLCEKRNSGSCPELPTVRMETLERPFKKVVMLTTFDDYLAHEFEVESLTLPEDSVEITHAEWANILIFH